MRAHCEYAGVRTDSCVCIPGWRLTCLSPAVSEVARGVWCSQHEHLLPFLLLLALGELVGCFFTLTERCLWILTLPGFTMLSTSISCYSVLSIILGNSISLTFQRLSQFLSLFSPRDTKKVCFHFIFIPHDQLCLQSHFLTFFSWQILFLWSFSLVLLSMWVSPCWLFCGISHLCFISLFNHSPSCHGSYWIGSWHHICTPSAD